MRTHGSPVAKRWWTPFAKKEDVYAITASAIFGYEVDPRVHKLVRFVGKPAVLGFGFGTGANKHEYP
jgi:hypothetical protein